MKVNHTHLNDDWKNVRLADIDLSARLYNCLYSMGLNTLGELASLSDADLLRHRNFGKRSLTKVKAVLASPEDFITGEECSVKHGTLDFLAIEEPLSSTLLQRLETLRFSTRTSNAVKGLGITTVGELVQFTERELLQTIGIGKAALDNIKAELTRIGLSLGILIENWPNKDELTFLLRARTLERLDKTQAAPAEFKYVEDELCSAVKTVLTTHESSLVIRRTGWGGDRVWTLEALASDPNASGRKSPVTRERIRQIESKALAKIQRAPPTTPLLKRAIALIEERAPIAVETIPNLLKEHGISRGGLTFKALRRAIKAFDLGWDVDYRTVSRYSYLLRSDQADQIERCWTTLVRRATSKDFVDIDEIVSLEQGTEPSSDVAVCGVYKIPSLSWIDGGRQIYWNLDRVKRGKNKTINVCRKIFTVTSDVPFKRLVAAVKRTKKVKEFPPDDTFTSMLIASEEFEVNDGVVSRGTRFRAVPLSKIDQVMVDTTTDCGTVTTFMQLRDALVRRGLSTNHAHVKMVLTPFWVTTARGKYRFVSNNAQLADFRGNESSDYSEIEAKQDRYIELEVNYRHMVTGSHRIEDSAVEPGQWLLTDDKGNSLGKIDVSAKMIKGLDLGFATAGLEVGTFVIIDFSREEFVAELIW